MEWKYDYSELRGRIIAKYGTLSAFAKHLGKVNSYVSNLLSGKAVFNQNTIVLWANSLQIETEDIHKYFFVIVDCTSKL